MGNTEMMEQGNEAAVRQIQEHIDSMGDLGDQESILYAARDLLQALKSGQNVTNTLIAKICMDRKLDDRINERAVVLLAMIASLKSAVADLSDFVEAHLQATSAARLF